MSEEKKAGETGVSIGSEYLLLKVAVCDGNVALKLTDGTTGRAWLDGPVVYRVRTVDGDRSVTTERLAAPAVETAGDAVIVTGQAQHFAVRHEFALEGAALRERITLRNTAQEIVPVDRLEIGATLPLTTHGGAGNLLPAVGDVEWVPIPGRRNKEDSTGGHDRFVARDLIMRRPDLWGGRHTGPRPTGGPPTRFGAEDAWFADGWCFTAGARTLVVLKHATEHCEVCPLDAEKRGGGWNARIGGVTLVATYGQHGTALMPADVTAAKPGQNIELGDVRYEQVDGDWRAGYEAFRNYFDSCGYTAPKDFDPPVHWNQLYDMSCWWTLYNTRIRRELYTLDALWEEARKAREYHCESLYLDPGWDTGFGSSVWAEDRLGPQAEFAAKLKRDYGLGLSLHCPLAGWSNASMYPEEALAMNAEGERIPGRLCSGSREYLELKAERMRRLCEDGATFLMYDGTGFTPPCCNPDHGHSIPYTADEQARNYRWLCEAVQGKYPHVLIELHDVEGHGVLPKHFPNRPGWYVENWGDEYMWSTAEDLFTGKMKFLDYTRRAYSIPTYLHISLINDNEHGLALWYAASTCAHLGIGGTHPNSMIAEAHKAHMAKYRKLKRFFVQGRYYAADEETHLHYLADRRAAVVCLFNFSDASVHRSDTVELPPDFELGADPQIHPHMHLLRQDPHRIHLNVVVPPRGANVMLLGQRDEITDPTIIW